MEQAGRAVAHSSVLLKRLIAHPGWTTQELGNHIGCFRGATLIDRGALSTHTAVLTVAFVIIVVAAAAAAAAAFIRRDGLRVGNPLPCSRDKCVKCRCCRRPTSVCSSSSSSFSLRKARTSKECLVARLDG